MKGGDVAWWGNHLLSLCVHMMDLNRCCVEVTITKRGFSLNSSLLMPTDDSYDQTRRDFEELEVEEQARFLIEASASTLAEGLERVGRILADELEEVMGRPDRSSAASGETGPGAAEPETAQRQAPQNGSSSET